MLPVVVEILIQCAGMPTLGIAIARSSPARAPPGLDSHDAIPFNGGSTTVKRLMQPSLALVALVAGLVSSAAAQSNSGSITATALVQQPINVLGAVNLSFGN